jgi:hypothetical protein
MADFWRDFWIRETGTGQQVAQLHDRYMMMRRRRSTAVGIVTMLRDGRSEARITVGATDVALLQNVQTASEAHPSPSTLHIVTKCRLVATFRSPPLYPQGKEPWYLVSSWLCDLHSWCGCLGEEVRLLIRNRSIFLRCPASGLVSVLTDLCLFQPKCPFIKIWTLYLLRKEKSVKETGSRLCVELYLVL